MKCKGYFWRADRRGELCTHKNVLTLTPGSQGQAVNSPGWITRP